MGVHNAANEDRLPNYRQGVGGNTRGTDMGAQEVVIVVMVKEIWEAKWEGKVHRQSHSSDERIIVSDNMSIEGYVYRKLAKGAKPVGKGRG